MDSLGSPAAWTASGTSKSTTAVHAYLPWGGTRHTSGTQYTDRDFTGQLKDGSSGLHFYNARYYDAAIGRFASPDSIVPNQWDARHFNRLAYVTNNPLRYTDPTGHDPYYKGSGTVADISFPNIPRNMGTLGSPMQGPIIVGAALAVATEYLADRYVSVGGSTDAAGGITVGQHAYEGAKARGESESLARLQALSAEARARTQDPDSDQEQVYYHYTTQAARGSILDPEYPFIDPSLDGHVYMPDTVYLSASLAQDRLALSSSPDGFFVIPSDRVPGVAPTNPHQVPANQYGRGGGNQYVYKGPVPSTD